MAKVVIKNLKKVYAHKKSKFNKKKNIEPTNNLQITSEGVVAVKDFNLEIDDNEFIVFVGPSGCGKTTTLRMIAGLEEITSGELYIDGKLVNDVEPKDRNIAMVFQNYALYPHMTVYENMAFSLTNANIEKKEIEKKIKEAAHILDITDLLDRKPKELSGGQRQRVAIGRAIVRNPKVFLMDEPLSNLDAKLRNQMRTEIIKLREKISSNFIYVTHDQVEAMTLGDRIVIMKDGIIQQIGTPKRVYNKPSNLFVASFIGTPQMNIFDNCRLYKDNGSYYIDFFGKKCLLSNEKQSYLNSVDYEESYVTVGIRPQDLNIVKKDGIQTTLYVSEMMGSEMHYHLILDSKEIIAIMPLSLSTNYEKINNNTIEVDFDPESLHIFDSKTKNNLFY